jgi:hypothetical protein
MVRPDSLQPVGRLVFGHAADSVRATPDGRHLLVAATTEPDICCGLYVIDLARRTGSLLVTPTDAGTFSPRADLLFVQRGAVGIEVYETAAWVRRSRIDAPGNYVLSASPDGRWLFGTTDWEGPSLDIVDVDANRLVRRLPVPYAGPSGTWLRDRFYLYAFDGRQGRLWTVAADSTGLGPARVVGAAPSMRTSTDPFRPFHRLIAAGRHLLL